MATRLNEIINQHPLPPLVSVLQYEQMRELVPFQGFFFHRSADFVSRTDQVI